MPISQYPIEEPDIEALDRFLTSDRAPQNCMMLSELDGFLTAIAIGPELVMPSKWLPAIWDGDEPGFRDEEEANIVLGAIIGRYNQILYQIDNDSFEPKFWQGPEGIVIAVDWAEGFVTAINMYLEAWTPLLESQDDVKIVLPILALCGSEDGGSLLGISVEDDIMVLANAAKTVPECVMEIAEFWKRIGDA